MGKEQTFLNFYATNFGNGNNSIVSLAQQFKGKTSQEIKDALTEIVGEGAIDENLDTINELASAIVELQKYHEDETSLENSLEQLINEKLGALVNGAPESLDTLKEIADAVTANTTSITSLESSIGAKVDKSLLENYQPKGDYLTEHQSLENYVTVEDLDSALTTKANTSDLEGYQPKGKYVEFTDVSTEQNPNRKSIVLGNHDILLGTKTDGETVNLAMLSKWDVTDYGSSKVHLNLNSIDKPTVNDNEPIALVSEIPTTLSSLTNDEGFITVDDADNKYQPKGDYALHNEMPTSLSQLENDVDFIKSSVVESKIADVTSEMMTEEKCDDKYQVKGEYALSNDIKDCVKFTDVSTEQNPNRKSIVLNNHDILLGAKTDGETVNLAMLSKWDVADYGSVKVHLNLNSMDKPTVNDNEPIALVSEIPTSLSQLNNDVDMLTKSEGDTLYQEKGNYALTENVNSAIEGLKASVSSLNNITLDIESVNNLLDLLSNLNSRITSLENTLSETPSYELYPAELDSLGGIKIGYDQNGNNYPIQLDDDGRAYVTVETTSETPSPNYVVYYDNGETKWTQPKVYMWKTDRTRDAVDVWDGIAMTHLVSSIWMYDYSDNPQFNQVIFKESNSNIQSSDLMLYPGHLYKCVHCDDTNKDGTDLGVFIPNE